MNARRFALCLGLMGFIGLPHALALPIGAQSAPQHDLAMGYSNLLGDQLLGQAVGLLKKGDRQQAKLKLAEFMKRRPNDPRGAELAGMILLEEGNLGMARLSFEQALSLNPNNASALAKLGVTLLLQGKRADGEKTLRQAIAQRAGEPLARRYLGWLEESRGNLNAAANHYIAILQGSELPAGKLNEAHAALGRVYNGLGRYEQTVRLLRPVVSGADAGPVANGAKMILASAYLEFDRPAEALPLIQSLEKTLKPDNPELQFLRAYAELGRAPAQARRKLQALAKAHPQHAGRSQFLIARSYALEGKLGLAAKELESLAAATDPSGLPTVLTALMAVRINAGQLPQAIGQLERYARKYPDNPEVAYLLAEAYRQQGNAEGSARVLRRLLAGHPDFAPAHYLAGLQARSLNKPAEAERHFQRSVTLDPSNASAWIALANVRFASNDLPKAEAALAQALQQNPGSAVLQFELAALYDVTERASQANALYREILAAYPEHVPTLNNLALNQAEGGDLQLARTYAQKAHALSNGTAAVGDTYGWVLVLSGDPRKGLPLLEQAARTLQDDSTVLYHLGAAYLRVGKTAEGRKLLQRALAMGVPKNVQQKIQALLNG